MKPSLEGIVNFFDPRKENVVEITEAINHLPFPALVRYVALHHFPKMAARGGVLVEGVVSCF